MTTVRLPNIILIVVDTLRGDHVSCYGHERRTTPHLDALAADATLYTTALSPGAWTPPSHASIFTGTYPSRHGVDRSHPYLDGDLTTLPEYLRGRGYRTFGISSNFWISTATHYDRGFDVFYQSWQLAQTRSNPALERQRRRDPSYSAGGNGRSAAERLGATINRLDAGIRRYCCRPFVNLDMGARRVNRVVRRWARTWKTLDAPLGASRSSSVTRAGSTAGRSPGSSRRSTSSRRSSRCSRMATLRPSWNRRSGRSFKRAHFRRSGRPAMWRLPSCVTSSRRFTCCGSDTPSSTGASTIGACGPSGRPLTST